MTLKKLKKAEIKNKNFKESESKALKKTKVCIIKITEKTEE